MRLPNSRNAIVPRRKVRDYLLSADHPVGRHKAAFFESLGYTQDQWPALAEVLQIHAGGRISRSSRRWYGRMFEIRGEIVGLNGRTASVITVWLVRPGERRARLVTAYPEG